RIVDALIAEEEERLVLAVVDARNVDRAANRSAPAVEQEIRARRAGLVQEEVVRPKARPLESIAHRAMEVVSAALDADVGDAALGLSELRVEGRGLHLE